MYIWDHFEVKREHIIFFSPYTETNVKESDIASTRTIR